MKNKDQAVSVLTLALSKAPAVKGKAGVRPFILTILTPLNIYLPVGFDLTIDSTPPIKTTYRNCNQAGCWVHKELIGSELRQLKKGRFGFGQMRLMNGQNVRIKFSLSGIGKALAALETGS